MICPPLAHIRGIQLWTFRMKTRIVEGCSITWGLTMNRLIMLLVCWVFGLVFLAPAQAGLITYRWSFTQTDEVHNGEGTVAGTLTYAFRVGQASATLRSFRVSALPGPHEYFWDAEGLGGDGIEMIRESCWSPNLDYYYFGGLGMQVNPITSEPVSISVMGVWARESEDIDFLFHTFPGHGNSSASVVSSLGQRYYYIHTEGPAQFERLSPPVPEPSAMVIWGSVGLIAHRARRRLRLGTT